MEAKLRPRLSKRNLNCYPGILRSIQASTDSDQAWMSSVSRCPDIRETTLGNTSSYSTCMTLFLGCVAPLSTRLS